MRAPADVLRKAVDGAGLTDAVRQRKKIDSLAVAVEENARLGDLLERQVADLERGLVPLLEADRRARRG